MEYGESSSSVALNHAFKYYDVIYDSIIRPLNDNWNKGDLAGVYRMLKLLLISTHTLYDKKYDGDVKDLFSQLDEISKYLFFSAVTLEQ